MHRLRAGARLLWRAQPGAAVVVVAGAIALGGVPVATAWLAKLIVDGLAEKHTGGRLWPIAGLALVVLMGQVGQGWLQYVQEQLARRIELSAHSELFAALNRLPGLAVFERPAFHDRVQLAQQAGQMASMQLVSVTSGVLQSTTSLIGFLGVLIVVSPAVAALAGVAIVPHLIAELRLTRERVSMHRGLSPGQRRSLFYARLQSEPQAARELRIFGLGAFFHTRMLGELRAILHSERGLARRVLRTQAALDTLTAVATSAGILLVVRLATVGQVTPGDVIVVLSALPTLALAVAGLVRQLAQGAEALMLVGHHQDLVDLAPAEAGAETLQQAVAPLRSGITVENVWFRYDDDLPWVLRGVDFHIPHGTSVGLVGLNGAGKSTLVKLICRLYEPTRGRILWDGVDLRDLNHASLRQRIGVVFQDFMTYDLTAAENIGLGDLPRLGELDHIEATAKKAGIHDAITRFPRGYQTMLSRTHGSVQDDAQGGLMPSGGQWQRLALARMLMRMDRDLLILDEPSSNLDAEAEYEVHRLVDQQIAGATRLLISHRLNAVRMADLIVVIEGGAVVEQGSHDELVGHDSRYAALFRTQAAGYRD